MEGKVDAEEDPGLELEHAIGFSGSVQGVLGYQPQEKNKFIYAAGGSVVLADFDDPHEQVFFQGHDDFISCTTISPSGRMLASGQQGENADVIVWDYAKKRLIYRFQEHDHGVRGVAFSHDERLLATIGSPADNKLIVWDLATGKIVASMVPKVKMFCAVSFGGYVKDIKRRDTRNYQLAVAGSGVTLLSLDPYLGRLTDTAANTGNTVRNYSCLAFSKDCELLYAGSDSGDVVVIKMKRAVLESTFPVCRIGVKSMVVGMNTMGDEILFVGGGDGSASVWGRRVDYYGEASYEKLNSTNLEGSVTSVSLMPRQGGADGKSIVHGEALFGTSAGFVKRMSLESGQSSQLLVCENHCGPVIGARYCHNISDRFATCSSDCSIRIWDASDYTTQVKAFVRDAGSPTSIDYSLDHIFTGWNDGRIRCNAAINGQPLWFIDEAHKVTKGQAVTALKLSNNEKFLLSGGKDGAVRVWEVRTKELVSHLKEHKDTVSQLTLFNDDIHALSCSQDRSFLCWDLREEKRISSHIQRTGGINSIALSYDQTYVITCGKERMITFWDLREPYPARTINPAHNGEGTCVATLNNHDHYFATGGTDQRVLLWDARTCRIITEGLGHSGTINSVVFSPDDKQLLSVGNDGNIFVWNLYL